MEKATEKPVLTADLERYIKNKVQIIMEERKIVFGEFEKEEYLNKFHEESRKLVKELNKKGCLAKTDLIKTEDGRSFYIILFNKLPEDYKEYVTAF